MTKKNVCIYVSLAIITYAQLLVCADPKISIIASVYNGDEFIEGFLADITRQTIFDQCELIMINANSQGNEEPIIKKYMAVYPNIIYKRLDKDPGIYSVWNMAISMSKGQYLTNANIDDRLAPECYEVHSAALDANPDIMLVYSDRYYTRAPNETFEKHSGAKVPPYPTFSKENMKYCLPSNNPMWRKTLHERVGFFDSSYKYSGDWEMWLRGTEAGVQFKKIEAYYSLYYLNPKGLSSAKETKNQREFEDQKIIARYGYLWGHETYREMYKLANMLEKAGTDQRAWSLALSYYLKAYSLDQLRAEPLIRIAQHYYETTHDNALTYLFINRACCIPCPEDMDYEKELYDFTRWDLLGIVSWYMGQYEKGEAAVRKALLYKPDDERLKSNLKFYVDRKN